MGDLGFALLGPCSPRFAGCLLETSTKAGRIHEGFQVCAAGLIDRESHSWSQLWHWEGRNHGLQPQAEQEREVGCVLPQPLWSVGHIVHDIFHFCCYVWYIKIIQGVRMMATVHPAISSLVPLLESLEDTAAGQVEQTDAYLTIANRLSGEDGKHFLLAVVKHFSRLGKLFQAHIVSPNVELSQAALQALGFCVFHSTIVSGIPANFVEEILVALNSLVVKSTDKNTCTRALWVISKQNFPSDAVVRKVPDILKTLEAVRAREDLQSVIMDHEALNVVIRLLEQTPGPMGEGAVQWARLVIPLVVHSASKKQQEVAAIIEPLMSSKLIPELQKLFSSKNESNVLKLWPLFVRLLGKLLTEEAPSSTPCSTWKSWDSAAPPPIIKKIAFIAWKSLIDNFALNPEILCSAKRLKLLMQPLSSIQVRTEALLLTKLEVWWYLVVRLGPNLAVNFEQVGVPLLQIAVSADSPLLSVTTPSRNSSQNTSLGPTTPKAGGLSFSSSSSTPRLGLNSSVSAQPAFGSIQLLGLEMLLHYLQGTPDPPTPHQPLLLHQTRRCTHLRRRDSFISIGKDAPEALLTLIWKSLIGFVTAAIETAGSKKDRPGSEVLTLLLQALESIVSSEALPAQRSMGLLEATVKGIPRKTLGSAAYQVANMDVLNGTPALFLILLFHHSSVLPAFVTDERFFLCLETLIGCGLSGPASPLAFSESVLGVMSRNAEAIENKEYLWRMWSVMINPLTDTITQTNEVNQGDALEHNFTAVHHALMFPVTHLLAGHALPQMTQKSLLGTWSRLYKAFARCSALVATAEENVCCEELCGKMAAVLDAKVLSSPSTLEALASILLIIIECVDFSPYTLQYQKTKSPHTPLGWVRKKNKALGNLTTFQSLLVQVLESFLSQDTPPEMLGEGTGSPSGGPGTVLIAILSALFSNLVLGTAVQGALSALSGPLALLYEQAGRPQNEQPKFFTSLGPKLEKLLGEILGCLQTRSSLAFDDELLVLLAPLLRVVFPHRSKQLRTLVTQFWNATFANAPILTYPEDLKPILSQVKQTTPIILPGFQAVDVPEDYSGQYSSECSQLETHVSGVKIASVGKRDSLLSRAGESKEKGSKAPSKPISVKLDFGSPKLPRRELLEEDASMDFVFIPPETKERLLTEHQKEVKRTKRVDIPAMYNNLDASQDTTAFTQYTQSQEDSVDKLPANEEAAETMKDEGQPEVQDEKMETEEAPEPDKGPIQVEMDVDSVAGEGAGKEKRPVTPEKVEPKCDDGPPEQGDVPAEETNVETAESSGDDCNISASSDVVSGTPQKPNSRRQSFITLEKYVEGKAASPIRVTTFTGPLSRASSSQDASHSQEKDSESRGTSEASAGMEAEQEPGPHGNSSEEQVSSQLEEALTNENEEQQPHPEVEEVGKPRCSDGTEDEDDIIPDTQIEVDSAETGKQKDKTPVEDTIPTNDEDSCAELTDDNLEDSYLNDSQCSQVSPSQSEIRRSGRRRSRPLRPGEDREEVEGRYKQMRKTSPGKGLTQSDSLKPDLSPASQIESQSHGRPGLRSKMPIEAQEVEGKERLGKTRADPQAASSQMAQNDSQSLGRVTRSKVAGPTDEEMSKTKSQMTLSTPASQTDSQSQGRSSRRSKSEHSQLADKGEGTQESSQVLDSYKTRGFSQGSGIENSESDVSETCEDGLVKKTWKRGRKRKLLDSEAKPTSPLKTQQVPEGSGQMEAMETSPEVQMENSESKSILVITEAEAVEPSEEKENKNLTKIMLPDGLVNPTVESRAELKSASEAFGNVTPEMREEISKPFLDPSSEIGNLTVNRQKVQTKRGRGRRRSRGYNRRAADARETLSQEILSQESDISDSQDLGETIVSPDPKERPLSDSKMMCPQPENALAQQEDDAGMNDDVFLEANTTSTPTVSELLLTATPSETVEKTWNTMTTEGTWNTCDSEFQSGIEVSDLTGDMEEGQQQGIEVPQGTDVTASTLDPDKEQGREENSVLQEKDFASVQEQNATKEVVLAAVEEEGKVEDTQIDTDMLIAAPADTIAVQALPDEPPAPQHVTAEPLCLDSPPKQKHLDSVAGEPEVGQSPSNGKMKGVWSPSASPSTSILKKGQKRPLEVESPSPLQKSRRVSFADPIHHQELADDIDRRSPVIRSSGGSSPRSKNLSAISSQQKFITTPTKSLLSLSPRNLRSPGYKSSKKCLISEMSQEPKAIPRDCVYPALVSCSTPVEAVLPQISSNMWPRGFGQLVRARNIRTVGDLSALTPTEIKSLPIRSPKLSNVKKALRNYHEQQRKGRSDDLKGFDEMEKMTSEPEETELAVHQEEGKPAVEQVTVAPPCSLSGADGCRVTSDAESSDVPAPPPAEQRPTELPSAVEALGARLTPEEMGQCSPGQLVLMHEQLGGMMRSIVVQLQARLAPSPGESIP
ncbi:hypothetical protein SKAU_G00243070 [Synaphobranchus kaupii]|uniref:Telomere-associated protein Rif1 N-terminal domain-containing protein n=1 Tax=Synaphobranchus kaupii TaxID=118154 RepID=A0A9Q1F7V4_SYNKA|nr:hypothetical protein SKAU_G00243070 [Synaphobranchus kaupii]